MPQCVYVCLYSKSVRTYVYTGVCTTVMHYSGGFPPQWWLNNLPPLQYWINDQMFGNNLALLRMICFLSFYYEIIHHDMFHGVQVC